MDAGTPWGGQDQNLPPGAQVDFQQFLDLGMSGMNEDVSFNYDGFEAQQQNDQMMRHEMDETMGTEEVAPHHKHVMNQGHEAMGPQAPRHTIPDGRAHGGNNGMNGQHGRGLTEIDAQIQYLQLQRQHHEQSLVQEQQQNYYVHHQARVIPPTPNSMEMHSRDRQPYGQHSVQQPFIYDPSQMRLRDHDLAFTPLVSPAVTPLDTNFRIPDYSVSGAFFSPLTSPALHAESGYGSLYAPSHPLSSVGTSPTDLGVDLLPIPSGGQAGLTRKFSGQAGKKAPSKPRASRAVRQSPIVKPQQRRKPTITAISPETLSELLEPELDSRTPSSHASSQPSNSLNCSPNKDSISPEHLSDMAPPPLPPPRSVKSSPYLLPQNSHPRVQQLIASHPNGLSPATPASLMKIARGKEDELASPTLDVGLDEDQFMEGFSLPGPAVGVADSGLEGPPMAEPEKSPLMELPPPAVAQLPLPPSASVKISPTVKPQSASSNVTPSPSLRKTPKLAARGSRDRHPGGSVQASPALLPKISPSIKPQTQHRNSVSDDTAQLLLTTKSNYQNILEGTHLPGVSYPSELSTNLTSKRTSHKIAEQGRRNRINVALQEIATLLPLNTGDKRSGGDGDEKDPGASKSGTSAGSKASTVEQAIDYIKHLKSEVEEAKRRAEEAEKKLQAQTNVHVQ